MKQLIVLILIVLSLFGYGQSFIGQVLDAETQEPVPFATILMTETENGVIADSEGHFYIEAYPRTILKLQISSVGYETYVENLDLSSTAKKHFHYSLRRL